MRVWGYAILISSAIGLLSGVLYSINKYINNEVENRYQTKMLETQLNKQNEAILRNSIDTELYNKNVSEIYNKIETSIPNEAFDINEKCENRIEKVNNMLDYLWDK